MTARSEKTIFALSTGSLPSGVAVVRVSGSKAREITEKLTGKELKPRKLEYCVFHCLGAGEVIDRGLAVIFEGPDSFTGEDVAELHLHGGKAVIARMLEELSRFEGTALAEPGEFSRRAFDNGKFDLTGAEGLADLINAETDAQRRLAVRQAGGGLSERLENWRESIIRARAFIEAEFDFSDEEDVPDSLQNEVRLIVSCLAEEIGEILDGSRAAEMVRDGYRIALLGRPNAGKSSLLNALAKRDVAIVSETPGTTRDVIEVKLDIGGVPVIISDTAGVRLTSDSIEAEGIERAKKAALEADHVFWLSEDGDIEENEFLDMVKDRLTVLLTKSDLGRTGGVASAVPVSVRTSDGLDALFHQLDSNLEMSATLSGDALVSRQRQKVELQGALENLERYLDTSLDLVLASEHLRLASHHIGRLTGRVDVEDLLDVVFGEFCIGK